MPAVPNVPGVPALASYSPNNVSLLTADSIVQSILQTLTWGIYYNLNGVEIPVIIPASIASSLLNNFFNNALAPFTTVASLLGLPNLLPVVASTIEFDFEANYHISDYPQEQGAFQSYNKVQMPFECRVRLACGGTIAQRQAFINSLLAILGGAPLGTNSLLGNISSTLTTAAGLAALPSSLTGLVLTGGTGAQAPPLFDLVTPEGTYASCSARRLAFSRRSYEGATLIAPELTFVQVRQTSPPTFSNTVIPGVAGQQGTGVVIPGGSTSLSALY